MRSSVSCGENITRIAWMNRFFPQTQTISNQINHWILETAYLESLPALTAEQESRRGDIGLAFNTYDVLLEDIATDPKEDFMERALTAVEYGPISFEGVNGHDLKTASSIDRNRLDSFFVCKILHG
jgi:hypothetical protein